MQHLTLGGVRKAAECSGNQQKDTSSHCTDNALAAESHLSVNENKY